MGSPEKPIDVEMGDMEETQKLNPDVKVEEGTEKADAAAEDRFTGLKKEELLEISSQRKWVVARWILFVLFWVGWVGMLVGAIIIVINAPRCKQEPSPVWYQDTVVYQADVRKYAGNLKGMTEHLDYVRLMNAKTLTVCHVSDSDDPMKLEQEDAFKGLVDSAHSEKAEDDVKVVVDLRIDALSIKSPQFVNSAKKSCSGGAAGQDCQLFVWSAEDPLPATDAMAKWILSGTRGESYKVSTADEGMAFLNYPSQDANSLLEALVGAWVGYGADGLQLRGLDSVAYPTDVVRLVRDALNETQSGVEKKKELGLFLLSPSSAVAEQVALFGSDVNDTTAPVVINTQLSSPPENKTGEWAQDIVKTWRNESKPFIGAFAVNTMDQSPLADRLGSARAAGLSLLSFTLPGVPIMKSGDEALLKDATLIWDETEAKIELPRNASEANVETLKDIADVRVSPFRTMQSIRWDDVNSVFKFRRTNSTDVFAFTRKWDTKPKVLVVSNLSTRDVWVKVASSDEDGELEVLYSSDGRITGKTKLSLKSIEMFSGLTLVLKIKKP